MAWVAVGIAVAGTAASVAGGEMSRNNALSNAKAQAAARNAALAKNIGVLDTFGQQNRDTFNANMNNYAPGTQQQMLTDAQTKRGDANVANITQDTGAGIPLAGDGAGNAASRSDLAKRMLAVYDGATARAKAVGKLGGYSDAWLQNNLNNAQAGRDIDVTNNYAAGRKGIAQTESDLAGAGAYQPPSIWGPALQGVGSIASAYGGATLGGGGGFDLSTPLPGSTPLGQGGIGHA